MLSHTSTDALKPQQLPSPDFVHPQVHVQGRHGEFKLLCRNVPLAVAQEFEESFKPRHICWKYKNQMQLVSIFIFQDPSLLHTLLKDVFQDDLRDLVQDALGKPLFLATFLLSQLSYSSHYIYWLKIGHRSPTFTVIYHMVWTPIMMAEFACK